MDNQWNVPGLLAKSLIVPVALYVAMADSASSSMEVSEPRSLRAGIYENAPKIYTDDHGNAVGFWPDLLRAIASEHGWSIEWVGCKWSQCLQLLEQGEIDVLPDVGVSETREKRFLFHEFPVLVSWTRVYSSGDYELRSILDLDGQRIAYLSESFNYHGDDGLAELLEAFDVDADPVPFPSYQAAFTALENGRVDAAITNKDFGNLFESEYDVVRTPVIFQPAQLKFAFPADAASSEYLADAIDASLRRMERDPDSPYYQLLEEHMGATGLKSFAIPKWVYQTALATVLMLLVMVATAIYLRNRLRTRETQLRSFFANSNSVLYMKDRRGRIELVNETLCELTQLQEHEVLGKTDYDLFPKENADAFRKNDEMVLATGRPQTIEEVLKGVRGTRYYISTKFPIRSERGEAFGIGGISVDYTTERNENVLREIQNNIFDQLLSGNGTLADHLRHLADECASRFEGTCLVFLERHSSDSTLLASAGLSPDVLASVMAVVRYGISSCSDEEALERWLDEQLPDELVAMEPDFPRLSGTNVFHSQDNQSVFGLCFIIEPGVDPEVHEQVAGGICGIARMVVEHSRLDRKVQLAESVFGATHDALVILDDQHRVLTSNPAFQSLLGTGKIPANANYLDLVPDSGLANPAERAAGGVREVRLERPDGESVAALERRVSGFDDEGNTGVEVLLLTDISSLKQQKEKVEFLANHDALTALPNRRLMDRHIGELIARHMEDDGGFAVAFVDMDRFKDINDSLGHDFGDKVLRAFARRLHAVLEEGDFVARTGGDEFVLLFDNVRSREEVERRIALILKMLDAPLEVGEREIFISLSIGTALYPLDASTREELLRNADAAMFHAKRDARVAASSYFPELTTQAVERLELEGAMRAAFEADRFSLAYQPQVDIETGRILGVECLLRWQGEDGKMVSPADFIPVAEATGLIVQLDHYVLKTAAAQAVAWRRSGIDFARLSVNISAVELDRPDFAERFLGVLEERGVDPRLIGIELTESVLMENLERVRSHLQRLEREGIHLAIDDFGTGYSSLSYLRDLKVDQLKIDKVFIQTMLENPNDSILCRTMIDIAHSMNLDVLAEGVETAEQAKVLLGMGCRSAQGYYYARPMDVAEFREWYDSGQVDAIAGGREA